MPTDPETGMAYDKVCSCGALLQFLDTGRAAAPMNVRTGRNHFTECPNRNRYRRGTGKRGVQTELGTRTR